MMTFYAAVGSYRTKKVNGRKMPYIQKLGRLHAISIPEFVIWSTLLWEVMTYDEVKKHFEEQMRMCTMPAPDFDELLDLLVKRKLVAKGIGYTGTDALYRIIADAFVVPYCVSKGKKAISTLKFWAKGDVSLLALAFRKREAPLKDSEEKVMNLVEQTPLSGAELVCCFDRNITDVSSAEKVIEGIYTDTDQQHIANESSVSANKTIVMEAISNLYLRRKILLELA